MDESRERGVYTPSRSRRHWGAPFLNHGDDEGSFLRANYSRESIIAKSTLPKVLDPGREGSIASMSR